MLSHHELAKLFLISRAPEQLALGDPDVGSLIEKNLVGLPRISDGGSNLQITGLGIAVLRALDRPQRRRSGYAPSH